MKIILSKADAEILSIFRRSFCVAFLFICFFFNAQIFISKDATLYITPGTLVVDQNTNTEVKLYIAKGAVAFDHSNSISGNKNIDILKKKNVKNRKLVFQKKEIKEINKAKQSKSVAKEIKSQYFVTLIDRLHFLFNTNKNYGNLFLPVSNNTYKSATVHQSIFYISQQFLSKRQRTIAYKADYYIHKSTRYFAIRPPPKFYII